MVEVIDLYGICTSGLDLGMNVPCASRLTVHFDPILRWMINWMAYGLRFFFFLGGASSA